MNGEQLLTAWIEDKIRQCQNYNRITNSAFLDLHQRILAEQICREHGGVPFCFFGGYEEAERTTAIFMPDYVDVTGQKEIKDYLLQKGDWNPLAVLHIVQRSSRELSHRDYLGSLTGLGVERKMIGDILVRADGADIVILKEISEFLVLHYDKAGSVSLDVSIKPLEKLSTPQVRTEERRDTVVSLRLDNVTAAAFSLSRTKAAAAIKRGIVFVNDLPSEKPERILKEGDKLVIRGKGKVILKAVSGVTRKDRVTIMLEKYV